MLAALMKNYAITVGAPVVTTVTMASKPERVLGETALIQTDGSALLKAAWLGRLRLMRLLIEGGTDVNKTNDEGRTALMVACLSKHKDTQSTDKSKMIKFLLDNKSDPNIQDRYGRTALMYACLEHTGTEVVSVLLNCDSDVRIVDKKGSSALVYAVNDGDPGVLRLLVDACKAQGKEVIIITTNKNIGYREAETKQYLDVPPTLPRTPPFGQCVTPSDIYFGQGSIALHSAREAKQSNSLKQTDDQYNYPHNGDSSTELRVPHLERAASEGSSDAADGSSARLQSPRHRLSPREATLDQSSISALHNRLLCRRVNAASPTEDSPVSSPRHEMNTSRLNNSSQSSIKSLGDLHLQIEDPRERTSNPPQLHAPRRPLVRRQSAEAFNTTALLGIYSGAMSPRTAKQQLTATNSNPLEVQIETAPSILPMSAIIANRRQSLPGMPPPLRKCQTIHSISIPSECLNNLTTSSESPTPATSCPTNLQGTHCDLPEEAEYSDEDGVYYDNDNDNEDGQGGNTSPRTDPKRPLAEGPASLIAMHRRQRFTQRRGSAPFVLDDELAHTRPGRLPPLKVNPSVPLPDIGRIREPAIRSGPSSPCRTERMDRRHSMQPEDLRSLTAFASRSRGNLRSYKGHSSESTESN